MSSSDAQPPLTRRQARERERASETGALPVVPPPMMAPSSSTPTSTASAETPRRRPGSHAAPLRPGPRSAASSSSAPVAPGSAASAGGTSTVAAPVPAPTPAPAPAPAPAPTPRSVPAQPSGEPAPPASAVEIVPGTGLTRRQLRALRLGDDAVKPVPLQAPSPQSSDRTVADVLDTVAVVEGRQHPSDATPSSAPVGNSQPARVSGAAAPASSGSSSSGSVEAPPVLDLEPAPDRSALEQATVADGSPAAIEPLEDAVEHAQEPRRRRSTWSPHLNDDPEHDDVAGDEHLEVTGEERADTARRPLDEPGATGSASAANAGPDSAEVEPALQLPLPAELPSPGEPVVFPLDLDDDAVVPPPSAPASAHEPVDAGASGAAVTPIPASALPAPVLPAPVLPASAPPAAAASSVDVGLSGDAGSAAVAAPSVDAATAGPESGDAGSPAGEPVGTRRGGARRADPDGSNPATTAFSAPVGHWSRQGAGSDDEVHQSETGVRRVTDVSTTALILPNSALGDVTGALNATGEVILTGSIDLPKSLSSTGSHRPIDGAEVDRLLDQQDEQPDTDASPVRASRAVSSHTSTRAVVLAAARPKQSRVPVVIGSIGGGVGVAAIIAIVWAVVSMH